MGVYNGLPYLRKSIESVLSQQYENFEFIIIDDASTDNSANVVAKYAEDDERIRLLENQENIGLTASLNRALNEAQGDFVARQDADDLSDPRRFERQVQFLKTHPDVAVLGTGARLVDAAGDEIDRRVVLTDPSLSDLQSKNHLIHGSVLARRSVLEDVGGYDEFFRYSQDYDLWLRLAANHDIRNVPDPLYILREHRNSIYFDRMEESTLYAFLARGQSTGTIAPETVEAVRADGIRTLYDRLSDPLRAAYHRALARTYLRYGHPTEARVEVRKARDAGANGAGAYVPYLLSFAPSPVLSGLRRAVRKYLNLTTRVRNAV